MPAKTLIVALFLVASGAAVAVAEDASTAPAQPSAATVTASADSCDGAGKTADCASTDAYKNGTTSGPVPRVVKKHGR